MSNNNKPQILGEKSYNGVLMAIRQKIEGIKTCDTITGNDLLGKAYQTLNESKTPILDLKEFTTNAEKLAADDATLCDVVAFCRKEAKSSDLNFLINLCKEEHFKEMSRTYHPKPEETIKAFESMFGESSTVIEQGIRNGLFDSMKSTLLGILKKEVDNGEKLNESLTKGNLIKYSPVGIRFENNDKVVHLMENCVIEIDENDNVRSLNESEISEIGLTHAAMRMMGAIQGLKYDSLNETFSLVNKWDFDCQLKDGVCTINGQQINKDDLKNLLLESVNCYQQFPTKVVENAAQFNRASYLHDADNMIMLFENFGQVLKYDNLETIKNLNENTFMLFDKKDTMTGNTPLIVAATDENLNNKLFESFGEMVEVTNMKLNESITDLFAPQLFNEQKVVAERNENIVKLNESIKQSNKLIEDATVIQNMADKDSPAYFEMATRISKLKTSLNENLNNLNYYKNEFGK